MKIRLGLVQLEIGTGITEELAEKLRELDADFICFPEYFFIETGFTTLLESAPNYDKDIRSLRSLSERTGAAVIGGSLVEQDTEKYYNTASIFKNGAETGKYRKIHLWGNQEKSYLAPGEHFKVFEVNDIKIGVLICADALFIESFEFYRENKVDIIFVPTTSPHKEGDTMHSKYERDKKIWLAGAQTAGCHIVKVSGVGTIFGKKILGRSLVVSPEKIVFRNSIVNEEKEGIISVDLNL